MGKFDKHVVVIHDNFILNGNYQIREFENNDINYKISGYFDVFVKYEDTYTKIDYLNISVSDPIDLLDNEIALDWNNLPLMLKEIIKDKIRNIAFLYIKGYFIDND